MKPETPTKTELADAIARLTKERDDWKCHFEMMERAGAEQAARADTNAEDCRRLTQERDESRAKIERLRGIEESLQAELDKAKGKAASVDCTRREIDRCREKLTAVTAERDEALAEIDRLRTDAGIAAQLNGGLRNSIERETQLNADIRAALLIAWPPDAPPEYVDTETLAARVVTELGRARAEMTERLVAQQRAHHGENERLRKIEAALDAWMEKEKARALRNCDLSAGADSEDEYPDELIDVLAAARSGCGPREVG